MKYRLSFLLGFVLLGATSALCQISHFQHVVIIFQENRTPDNLFQGLCGPTRSLCPNPYDLQSFGINSQGVQIPLAQITLGTTFDLGHTHDDFRLMCDLNPLTNQCKMDGADKVSCWPKQNCPSNPQFEYVQSSDVGPYLAMAKQYGWANHMFQTNQGPSFPAHQFIFGGTSAQDASDDLSAIFVSENGTSALGCLAPLNATSKVVTPQVAPRESTLTNNPLGTLCFSHPTMGTLLDQYALTWKYYAPGINSVWTAPNSIRDICVPDSTYTECTGADWLNNVDLTPKDVLTDIAACKLANVTWVMPTGQNSDHASGNETGGPSWVASIVNAIGTSTACDNNTGYWNNTAIILTWDDWGGWYDHVAPPLLSVPSQGLGDYEYGFRVPLVVISAYTLPGYVNNNPLDFGSILRFVEYNFRIPQGSLNFADARTRFNLTSFFNLVSTPRPFQVISAPLDANFFLNDDSPMEPPDND